MRVSRVTISEATEEASAFPAGRNARPGSADFLAMNGAGHGPNARNGNGANSAAIGTADDAELMGRVRHGDEAAFAAIVERRWRGVLLYARQLAQDIDAAEDLAQEAFASLWQHRRRFRGGSVQVWLLRTIRHQFVSRQRRGRTHARWVATQAVHGRSGPRTPLQDLEAGELRIAILEAVATLSPRRREAFTLVHLQGLSNREVAEIMDVRPQTVANYLQAAIADLRTALKPFFPSFS